MCTLCHRVRRGCCACPKPSNDRRFTTILKLCLWIEIPDALFGLLAHPLAVVAHIVGQAFCTFPGAVGIAIGIYWRLVVKFWRNLDQRFRNQDSDRIEVGTVGAEPKALCFQRDRASAAERVINRRCLCLQISQNRVRIGLRGRFLIQPPGDGPGDFPACLVEDVLVGRRLPRNHSLDDLVEAFALVLPVLFRREAIRPRRGIIDELREQHGTARCQWAARPP